EVQDESQRERADRDVREHRMQRMAEPRPVEEVLDRPDRPEEGREPAVIEVAERLRPAVVHGNEPGQEMGHRHPPSSVDATPTEPGPDAGRAIDGGRGGPPIRYAGG